MEDIIQRLERSAESAYDRAYMGNGMMKCACGIVYPENDGMVLTDNPYAMPSCPQCAEKCFEQLESNKGAAKWLNILLFMS